MASSTRTDLGVRIVIRVSADLAARVREAARRDRRPLSQWVRNLLEDAVRRPG